MALPLPAPTSMQTPSRIRRGWLRTGSSAAPNRRLISLDRARERIYEVECLYPDRKVPIPLGDLDSAMPICNACAAAAHLPPRRGLTQVLVDLTLTASRPSVDGRARLRTP